jgi:hypothetical protein
VHLAMLLISTAVACSFVVSGMKVLTCHAAYQSGDAQCAEAMVWVRKGSAFVCLLRVESAAGVNRWKCCGHTEDMQSKHQSL